MRDLHVVIPTVGRPSCRSVAHEAIIREDRLARLTIVRQGGDAVIDDDLARAAAERSIALREVVLARALGPAQARHTGVALGDETFVGFLDDDIRFDAGSLSALAVGCEQTGWGGACGVLSVRDTAVVAMVAKHICFRSIFRDPRPFATWRRRPVRSNLLSGGMCVYRRALYERCASAWLDIAPYARGEDIELSHAVSLLAPLAVDPAVRVQNLSARHGTMGASASAQAHRNLDRYRTFATRHATARRHWLAYLAVLAGVLARGLRSGAGTTFVREVLQEGVRALRAGTRRQHPARTMASTTAGHSATGGPTTGREPMPVPLTRDVEWDSGSAPEPPPETGGVFQA